MTRADAHRIAERAEPGRAFTDAEIDAMIDLARALVASPPARIASRTEEKPASASDHNSISSYGAAGTNVPM